MVKCAKCGQSGHNKKTCKSPFQINYQKKKVIAQSEISHNPAIFTLSEPNSEPITEDIITLADNFMKNTNIAVPIGISQDTAQNETILSVSHWKNSNAYKQIGTKLSQVEFYKQNNCAPEICKLVELEFKSFGTCSENLIVELFELKPRTSSQNDGVKHGKKIEIKTARYWTGTNDCKWQHIELDYDYDIIILALLDFNGFKVWALKKQTLISDLKTKNILTPQVKQGYWMKKSETLPYLIPINNMLDFDNFIQS